MSSGRSLYVVDACHSAGPVVLSDRPCAHCPAGLDDHYVWEIGMLRQRGTPITYVIGQPTEP